MGWFFNNKEDEDKEDEDKVVGYNKHGPVHESDVDEDFGYRNTEIPPDARNTG
jgi:hypothetical protein